MFKESQSNKVSFIGVNYVFFSSFELTKCKQDVYIIINLIYIARESDASLSTPTPAYYQARKHILFIIYCKYLLKSTISLCNIKKIGIKKLYPNIKKGVGLVQKQKKKIDISIKKKLNSWFK